MRKIITTVGTSLKSNFEREKKEKTTSDVLFYYLRSTDVKKASAETNSLSRILKGDDSIVLLHSDTPEGELCADVLRRYYQKNKHEAVIERVVDLRYDESVFKVKGLRFLYSRTL
jgi:putative CRISPR-associated protein (TIGR02619 family)